MRRKKDTLIPIEISVLDAALDLRARGTEAAHGFLIAKVISDITGARQLSAQGTLYRALHRLERAGFMESFWENPQIALEEGRPTRRFYRVTVAGEQALVQAKSQHKAGQSTLVPRRADP
jgi:PadR family transcriptional regulator, regulatory protein PadR